MATPEVTLGGLSLNGVEPVTGVKWSLDKFTGWGSPASTVAVTQKPRQLGGWAGQGYLAPRHIAAEGFVRAPSETALWDALDRLNVACALTPMPLLVAEESGRVRYATVRREDEVLVTFLTPKVARWSIQVVAPDPRRFEFDLSDSTSLPSTSGGIVVPGVVVPFTLAATVVTGQVSLFNPGNIAGPVKLRIDGPVTGPEVTHVSTGQTLKFAASVVLGVGEWIDVDLERRTVLANGQSSRNGWVTSRGWFSFQPGDNVFSFAAAAYNAASRLTVVASPAWQ